jgi:uncharacterized protein YuzE
MAEKLTFSYDRVGDILYIDKVPPYKEQDSEAIGDDIVARMNPTSGEVENLEVLFFSTRVRGESFELPVSGDLRLVS